MRNGGELLRVVGVVRHHIVYAGPLRAAGFRSFSETFECRLPLCDAAIARVRYQKTGGTRSNRDLEYKGSVPEERGDHSRLQQF